MDGTQLAYETIATLGFLIAVISAVYRLSLVPSQKIAQTWRNNWKNRVIEEVEIEGMPSGRKQMIVDGKERSYWLYTMVTCPECFGTWLSALIFLPALFLFSPCSTLPLYAQIVFGLPIVLAAQQRLVNI